MATPSAVGIPARRRPRGWWAAVAVIVALDLWVAFALDAKLLALAPLVIGAVVLLVGFIGSVYRNERFRWETLTGLTGVGRAGTVIAPGGDMMAFPRALYYLGTLLICALLLRAGSLTVSDGVFFMSLGAAAALLVARRGRAESGLPAIVVYGTLVFAFGGLISSFGAASPLGSLSVVLRVLYLVFGWFWLGTVVLTKPEHVRTALIFFVVSAALNGLVATLQTVTTSGVVPGASYSWGRASGLTTVPTDLGGIASVALAPALTALLPHTGFKPWQRVTAAVCLPFIIAGLMFSGAITGAIGAVLGVCVWTAATRSYKYVAAGAAILVIVFAYLTAAGTLPYFKSPLARLQQSTTQGHGDNSTFWTRMETNEVAWKVIRNDPIVGVGLLPGDTPTSTGLAVHNLFVKPWFEGGVFAALGMFAIYVAVGVAGWRAAVRARSESERLLAIALATSYGCFLVWAMAEPQLYKRFCWVGGALILAVRAQQIRSARAAMPPATEQAPAAVAVPRTPPWRPRPLPS